LLYQTAKLDLMRLLGRELSETERRSLFAEANQIMQHCVQDRQPRQWQIAFKQDQSLLGVPISSSLVYRVTPPNV
jgi:hypothetical protein